MAKSFLLDTRGMVANTIDGELKGYLGYDFNGNQYLIDENGLPHLIPDKEEIFNQKIIMTPLEKETMGITKKAARKYIYNEVDWEQRRYEIARDVLASILSENREIEFYYDIETDEVGGLTPVIKRNISLFAKAAVLTADALVKELKKGGEE